MAASAIAILGCSSGVPTEGDINDRGESLRAPADPSLKAPGLGEDHGTAELNPSGTCDHNVCESGTPLATGCDTCVDQICAVDSFCCTGAWDSICVSEVTSICGQQCAATCGDGLCSAGEACDTCAQDCGACPTCGDQICQWGEACDTCSQDCGACPVCGDGACDWTESCDTCSQDCGACPTCGDGTCDWNESCGSCSQDCGACVCHDECVVGLPLDPSCGSCEATVCAQDPFCCQGYWDGLCVSEVASLCGQQCPVTCGDGLCDASESCSTCSQDCGACPTCGDQICQWGETCDTCSQDCGACPVCGDGACDWTESCDTCSQDCGACPVCGDGTCDWNESCDTCSQDCGACPTCGDGTCDWNESCSSCNQDCGACVCHDVCETGAALDASCDPCAAQVCAQDMFCCQGQWDSLCVSQVSSVCGQTCP